MSIINNNLLLAGTDEAYNLTRSLRFRSSASAYLSRTIGTPTNNKIFTVSFWVKRGALNGVRQQLIGAIASGAGAYWDVEFNANNGITIYDSNAPTSTALVTTAVYRDVAAWYHIVVAEDTTQATASNRTKLYVNGVQVTSFSTSDYATQNSNPYFNSASSTASIGSYNPYTVPNYFDGYLAEINVVDGQALTPSSFGSTNTLTGVWQPARYTGTYGTNGFYLPFTDNSALTTSSNVGLGKDFSGNGNYWTTNNISITAGVTYDSMTDVPTLTSATAANFAVLNPVGLGLDATLTNGNLTIAYGSSVTRTGTAASIGMATGKYYWEITVTASSASPCNGEIGITNTVENSSVSSGIGYYVGYTANGWAYEGNAGNKVTNATGVAYGSSYTTNDVIGVAFDATAGSLTYYKNGASQGVAFSGLPAGTYYPAVGDGGGTGTITFVANFGQQPFAYTPPTGYVALNTYNLPDSTILAGNKVMDATLYIGNSGTQSVVNAAGFRPDFVWAKARSVAYSNALYDSVRGATKTLFSNATNAEATEATTLTAFNSNGFTLGNEPRTNESPNTYVAWQWQAGQGTTSSNTSGSITSTVSVNASAGFSIVTYTGTGANATVGHGLGVAPSLIIIKQRSAGATYWATYHVSVGNTSVIYLNDTGAAFASSVYWNNTSPTSSVFTIGTSSYQNTNGSTYVAYCWTPIAGYSSFGSYTGNGSSNGPFVYLGFRPRFILVKRTDSISDWVIKDTARDPYNTMSTYLYPNASSAEGSGAYLIDCLSNGFKIRDSFGSWNASGGTYIYAAFASNPFRNSLAQ